MTADTVVQGKKKIKRRVCHKHSTGRVCVGTENCYCVIAWQLVGDAFDRIFEPSAHNRHEDECAINFMSSNKIACTGTSCRRWKWRRANSRPRQGKYQTGAISFYFIFKHSHRHVASFSHRLCKPPHSRSPTPHDFDDKIIIIIIKSRAKNENFIFIYFPEWFRKIRNLFNKQLFIIHSRLLTIGRFPFCFSFFSFFFFYWNFVSFLCVDWVYSAILLCVFVFTAFSDYERAD